MDNQYAVPQSTNNGVQSVIIYNSRAEYELANNPEAQEAIAVFMFWLIVGSIVFCIAYSGFQKFKQYRSKQKTSYFRKKRGW